MRVFCAITLLWLLALVSPAEAQMYRSIVLDTPTSVTTGAASTVWNLREKTVQVTKTSGTLAASLECLLADASGPVVTVDGSVSDTKTITYDRPCYALRFNVTTCTSCVWSAQLVGFPIPR